MNAKISLLLIVGCLSGTLAFSQAQFAVGIKAGPNFSKIKAADETIASATNDNSSFFIVKVKLFYGVKLGKHFTQKNLIQ